jgi:hypothetical protein
LTYKSGGKDYHGGLFEFLRNSDLDAKPFSISKTAPIPEFRLNQFGGFIGGRVNPRAKDPPVPMSSIVLVVAHEVDN